MNTKEDKLWDDDYFVLEHAGWIYLGCDQWQNHITGLKYTTSCARGIQRQQVLTTNKLIRQAKQEQELVNNGFIINSKGQWFQKSTGDLGDFKWARKMLQHYKDIKSGKFYAPRPPKLIHSSDWQGLIRELNRQLKSCSLKIRYRTRPEDYQIAVKVERIPRPSPVEDLDDVE